MFQYRKRYEVTCDAVRLSEGYTGAEFQYRKRYEVTCDVEKVKNEHGDAEQFQYRKRYEVTCDLFFSLF